MSETSVLNAVARLLNDAALGTSCAVWEKDNPIPLVSECPAIRLKVGEGAIREKRLSGGAGNGTTLGGYKQVDWSMELHFFQYDNGDGYERFIDLVNAVKDVLRHHYRLDGLADEPPSFLMLQAEVMDTEEDASEVTTESPPVLRHIVVRDMIQEI